MYFSRLFSHLIWVTATVVILCGAVFAYSLHRDTIEYRALAVADQRGASMRLSFIPAEEGMMWDRQAIRSALTLDGEAFSDPRETEITTTHGSLEITPTSDRVQTGSILLLSASRYNTLKTTTPRLAHDIRLRIGVSPVITITPRGLPRDRWYRVEMRGFSREIHPDMIRIWGSHLSDSGCSIDAALGDDLLAPVLYQTDALYESLDHDTLDLTLPDEAIDTPCLVAGVSGTMEAFPIHTPPAPLTLKANTLLVRGSGAISTQQIVVDFSEPIFQERDGDPREKQSYRESQRDLILKHLSLSPYREITPEMVDLTPTRLTISTRDFLGSDFWLTIAGVEDIYGQQADLQYQIPALPDQLGLMVEGSSFLPGDTIPASLLSTDTTHPSYQWSLCEVSRETFARTQVLHSWSREGKCREKTILTSRQDMISAVDLSGFSPFPQKLGYHTLAFARPEDRERAGRSSSGGAFTTFSVVNTHISTHLIGTTLSIFATDREHSDPIAGLPISLSKILSGSVDSLSHEIQLGETDETGFLTVDLSSILGTVPDRYGETDKDWIESRQLWIEGRDREYFGWTRLDRSDDELISKQWSPPTSSLESGEVSTKVCKPLDLSHVPIFPHSSPRVACILTTPPPFLDSSGSLLDPWKSPSTPAPHPSLHLSLTVGVDGLTDDGYPIGLRQHPTEDPDESVYSDFYEANLLFHLRVETIHQSGFPLASESFSYRVFRYRLDSMGRDEGNADVFITDRVMTGDDGVSLLSIPVDHSSYHHDYRYVVEIMALDPITGETIISSQSRLVRLPQQYRSFDRDDPLFPELSHTILSSHDPLTGTYRLESGAHFSHALIGKYRYELTRSDTTVGGGVETVMASGAILSRGFSFSLSDMPHGVYSLRVMPVGVERGSPLVRSEMFYYGSDVVVRNPSPDIHPPLQLFSDVTTSGSLIRVTSLVTLPYPDDRVVLFFSQGGRLLDQSSIGGSGSTLLVTRTLPHIDPMTPLTVEVLRIAR